MHALFRGIVFCHVVLLRIGRHNIGIYQIVNICVLVGRFGFIGFLRKHQIIGIYILVGNLGRLGAIKHHIFDIIIDINALRHGFFREHQSIGIHIAVSFFGSVGFRNHQITDVGIFVNVFGGIGFREHQIVDVRRFIGKILRIGFGKYQIADAFRLYLFILFILCKSGVLGFRVILRFIFSVILRFLFRFYRIIKKIAFFLPFFKAADNLEVILGVVVGEHLHQERKRIYSGADKKHGKEQIGSVKALAEHAEQFISAEGQRESRHGKSVDEQSLDGVSALDSRNDHRVGEEIERQENKAEQRGGVLGVDARLGRLQELINQLGAAPQRGEHIEHR